jgi:hypothetical protein
MYVTVPPNGVDFSTRMSTFGNHRETVRSAPRGGDLMIRYPNGTIRNLTQEAGFGSVGVQGANSIAVREPCVHWSANKAVFSMLIGVGPGSVWQMYEVTGFRPGEMVRITRVANQPADYNNVSPIYGSDGRLIFTSDRPRSGERHLYPQHDEYESVASITGLWSINPTSAGGDLRLLNHTPSGAFSPLVNRRGKINFIRWDHLQRDQQFDIGTYGAYNVADESAGAAIAPTLEVFPEPRRALAPFLGFTFNHFAPWEVNQDGTQEETLNHIGRHELNSGYMQRSFAGDGSLRDSVPDSGHANRVYLREDGGMFHLKEDPRTPGTYYGIAAREFGSLTTNRIIKISGVNPEDMVVNNVTVDRIDSSSPEGRFRNPLPTITGALVAAHTPATAPTAIVGTELRIKQLVLNASTGLYQAGPALTPGTVKSLSGPGVNVSYSGMLWEIEPVEVVAMPVPPLQSEPPIEGPESAILAEERVDEAALRSWLRTNNLALIVTRNQTSRDRNDRQQPYNLNVPGGVSRVVPGSGGPTRAITHLQIMEAQQVRKYTGRTGARVLAQPMRNSRNPATAGPVGSVQIAPDGSTAAFVPARRALTWHTTTPDGASVVKERYWVTFQPGEVRTCASCHGANRADQAGFAPPMNRPEALRTLLRYWKTLPR